MAHTQSKSRYILVSEVATEEPAGEPTEEPAGEGSGATAAAATGDDDGLSSGTAAIVGVVVAAVVFCAVAAGLFYRMGKKRSSSAEEPQEGEKPEQEANLEGYASDENVQL